MPNIIEVTDLSSPALDVFARLTEAQLRNRLEPEQGVFIAESPKVIALALDTGCVPVSLLVERRQLGNRARGIIARCEGVPVYTAADSLLENLTGFRLSGGVLAAMRRPRLPAAGELLRGARRVAALDNLADSTNVGAVFRSAAALGVDAVLVTPTCSDPLLRRSVRVSMGTIFQVPWTRIGGDYIGGLRDFGFTVIAMALSDGALDVDDPRLTAPDRLAIILGSEGCGLPPATIAACDYAARIPMSNQVDSLNVAAASAVAFWALRVR